MVHLDVEDEIIYFAVNGKTLLEELLGKEVSNVHSPQARHSVPRLVGVLGQPLECSGHCSGLSVFRMRPPMLFMLPLGAPTLSALGS